MTGVLKLYPWVPTLQQYAMMFAWSVTVTPNTSKNSIWDHHQRMACKKARAEGMPGTAAPVFLSTGFAQPGSQLQCFLCTFGYERWILCNCLYIYRYTLIFIYIYIYVHIYIYTITQNLGMLTLPWWVSTCCYMQVSTYCTIEHALRGLSGCSTSGLHAAKDRTNQTVWQQEDSLRCWNRLTYAIYYFSTSAWSFFLHSAPLYHCQFIWKGNPSPSQWQLRKSNCVPWLGKG